MLMVPYLADDYTKHRSYADVHSGSDLWENIQPVDKEQAVPFRQNGHMFNETRIHAMNQKILGIKSVNLKEGRENDKKHFQTLTGRIHTDTTELTTFAVTKGNENEDNPQFNSWYKPVKHIPKRLVNGKVKDAYFPNNERHTMEHWDTCIKTIEKFLESGAIMLMSHGFRPDLSATFVLANADCPIKKTRACYDGGAYKTLEAYKTECKLDGLPEITKILFLLFKIGKVDDSSGFHLVGLNEESKPLCCFEFAGRWFMYNALPFGERKSPSTFQRVNKIVVNFLRRFGIIISLYLDDRLIAEPFRAEAPNPEKEQDLARNMFLALIILVAAGGFINLEKSVFKPSYEQEFLGMHLNAKRCIVSVTEEKWARFQEFLRNILARGWMTLHEAEKLRGQAIAFLFASRNLKFFTAEMTVAIKQVYAKNRGKLHRLFKNAKITLNEHLKKEFNEWTDCKLIETKRCWLHKPLLGVKAKSLYTDSSLAQLGGALWEDQVKIGK